jgi:hypothetical protein
MAYTTQTIDEVERVDICDPDQQVEAPLLADTEVIYVRCDSPNCNEHAFDTRETLKRAGWDLLDGSAWCAAHLF